MIWAWRVLLCLGLAALGYCGYALADGWLYQERENRLLDTLRSAPSKARPAVSLSTLPAGDGGMLIPASAEYPASDLFGRMEIPRLGLSVVVAEGVGLASLRHAAGHIPGTGLPGQPGNIGISAHRDTYFRPLRNVRTGDIVILATPPGTYRYSVVSTKVVPPSEVGVLNGDGGEELTLVTCYPFYFVGAAPDRFIVRAERIL